MSLRFGAFEFDSRTRAIMRDGEALHLSPKAFLLLEMLIDHRPAPVSRETLYARLWPDVVVEPGNLHGLIAEIRSALGDEEHLIIRTVHRVGYAFTAPADNAARFAIIVGEREVELHPGENVIGRDPHDAISIRTSEVSRHHARLIVNGETVSIEDLGSKNGTFIGRTPVTRATVLHPGDEILVGTVRLLFVRLDPMATTVTAG